MLQISQPSLTKSIQVPEATLGVKLFDRQHGGVVLTDFGELVVTHIRGVVASENEPLHRIGLKAGLETGPVKVALGPYPSMKSGDVAAGNLLTKHPKLGASLRMTNWLEITRPVREGRVDLGVAELTDAATDDVFQTEMVGQRQRRFFCRLGHSILGRRPIGLADLLAFPWATARVPPRLAAAFPRPVESAGYIDAFNGDFVPSMEIDVPMQFPGLSARGDVIELGALQMVANELNAGALAVVPALKFDFHTSYGFIYLRDRVPKDRSWPIVPVDGPQRNDCSRGIAAVGGAKRYGSKGSNAPVGSAAGDGFLPSQAGRPVGRRTTTDGRELPSPTVDPFPTHGSR